ncbi:MAG: hypothetical protein JWM34_3256 [Ilumatobacteraceae bacterium]|nr:hypothetical protein [Ilumatobacteraceae bacterium]
MPLTTYRFDKALAESQDFATFSSSSALFASAYAENYKAAALDADELSALDGLEQLIVLALVEDGCSDVIANLPIMARIADDTGMLRLHVLSRDSNRYIADHYAQGGHSHIPTYVFLSQTGQDRGVLIERTDAVHEAVAASVQQYLDAHPEIDRAQFPYGLDPAQQSELIEWGATSRVASRAIERRTIVETVRQIATN